MWPRFGPHRESASDHRRVVETDSGYDLGWARPVVYFQPCRWWLEFATGLIGHGRDLLLASLADDRGPPRAFSVIYGRDPPWASFGRGLGQRLRFLIGRGQNPRRTSSNEGRDPRIWPRRPRLESAAGLDGDGRDRSLPPAFLDIARTSHEPRWTCIIVECCEVSCDVGCK